jgi:hypothetical protein
MAHLTQTSVDTEKYISIPASVEVIEESAFEGCTGLESCLIAEDANLRMIEKRAFSECRSLRSFCVPQRIEVIGENCFSKCISLHRLRLVSTESLNKLVGDSTLDEALENVGLDEVLSVLRIEIGDEEYLLNYQDGHLGLMKVQI